MRSLQRRAAFALLVAACFPRVAFSAPEEPLSGPAARLRAYVRIDTSNPPGNEKEGALFLARQLDDAGIPSEIFEPRPGRAALYARIRGTGARGGLLLHHHIDVVPAAREAWGLPPFAGAISGKVLVGRGTIDDKSLGVAELDAFIDLRRSGSPPLCDVVLLATADEETGGALGVSLLLKERPAWFAGISDAIGEGGLVETIVDRPRLFGIEVQQKGALWLRLSASGRGGHAALPDAGNPGIRIARAVAAITARSRPLRLEALVERAFRSREGIGKGRPPTAEMRRLLLEDPARLRAQLTPRDLALLTDTVALTRMGTDSNAQNALPKSAWADLDVRLLPSTEPEEMLRWLRETIGDPLVKVEVSLKARSGPASPEAGLFAVIQKVLRQRFPEAAVVADVSPALSENRVLRSAGIRTYGLLPFRLNYYDQAGIHGTNERIRIDWFEEGVETMKRIVRSWAFQR